MFSTQFNRKALIYKDFLYCNQLCPTCYTSAAEKSRQKYGKSVNQNVTTEPSYCYAQCPPWVTVMLL